MDWRSLIGGFGLGCCEGLSSLMELKFDCELLQWDRCCEVALNGRSVSGENNEEDWTQMERTGGWEWRE